MKKQNLMVLALAAFLAAPAAHACRMDMHSIAFTGKNDLMLRAMKEAAKAEPALNLEEIIGIEMKDYDLKISKNTPMCPEELTHNGIVVLKTSQNCSLAFKVTKIQPLTGDVQRPTYQVGALPGNCSK